MNIDTIIRSISGVLVAVTVISCLTFYQYSELQAMKSNIESAIVKGIDPIAVKCAYKTDSTMCSLYASKK